MSDTPKNHSIVARSVRKQADLKGRIGRKKSDQASLNEEASQIAQKLRELTDFIANGRLLSIRKGKSYPIRDQLRFIKRLSYLISKFKGHYWEIFNSLDRMHDEYLHIHTIIYLFNPPIKVTTPFNSFNIKTTKTIRNLSKDKKRMDEIINSLMDQIVSSALKHQINFPYFLKTVMWCFIDDVPKATSTEIARHMLNILQSVAEIPSQALPSFHTLRQHVSKEKKFRPLVIARLLQHAKKMESNKS